MRYFICYFCWNMYNAVCIIKNIFYKSCCFKNIRTVSTKVSANFLKYYFTFILGLSEKSLTGAIKKAGAIYNEIGKLFEEQPKLDWEPLGDTLHIFKGILAAFPDILTVHKVRKFLHHYEL